MYPNPQDALPLPSRPSLEQIKKRAKNLVRACRSGTPDAIRDWAAAWIRTLRDSTDVDRDADQVAQFAHSKLASTCLLADAQFVIARAHGFSSWPRLVTHLEALAGTRSEISAFETAANAIVAGDAATVRRLLQENPGLIRTRSTREHNATLLHYVSANGVEGYRQKSPKNIAAIATMLLDAGAEVDAEADVYGGGCTALGLVATSAPPAIAGVQLTVIETLLEHGARMDRSGSGGRDHGLIRACLGNGQPEAAEYLVSRGAPLDLLEAAGLGRLDIVKRYFNDNGELTEGATRAQMVEGFSLACAYGRAAVIDFLLDRGIDVDIELKGHGEGHTGLHVAAFHGHDDAVQRLLRRGARTDVIDKTWGTPPLIWALTGWDMKRPPNERYYRVVSRLVAAGAAVRPDLLEWDKAREDPNMVAALMGRTESQ